uniref:Small ribosomal subunit protein uS3c n=1 Tax=Nephroselmis olivacea TaxID=31312 RepID=RR3_NEPOL|nr:ribosomal protein S3 [Nephroselmis olivacea]Q9TL20.1 RecName: Full=Small ribosomal subunit protein uS3c; AltName: Full=30S ribosomal protein S3, chloroplastic [Nephroselmis olivacea]AAD54796.1 ribosomal protein S3 [Nephroselmis olivacea]
MGQKIHPLGFRLGITQQHRSTWFAPRKLYVSWIHEERQLRDYLKTRLADAGVANVQLTRQSDRIEVEIHTACPGAIVGRTGQGLEILREDIQKRLPKVRRVIVHVVEIANPDAQAVLIGGIIAKQLEERIPFRRAVRQAVQRAMRAPGVEGIKIEVSGRLNGAEIARSEWVREGRVPLHTLRADVDYCDCTAQTIYGVLGIKVWIFRGEIRPVRQVLAPGT